MSNTVTHNIVTIRMKFSSLVSENNILKKFQQDFML